MSSFNKVHPPRNQIPRGRVIGSKWTSRTEREGWVHFHVITLSHDEGGYRVELAASCERKTRFWVDLEELKNPGAWAPGWVKNAKTSE
ncbi:MAG: TIGR02450 family Trp-rich protein [Silvanigrellales bacterium]|nr:TIGR02450 family Trp-rich protein [Silvanigrellales bacterium]